MENLDIKKLKIIETVPFLAGRLSAMIEGADFPPPAGFWVIAVGMVIIAVIQWFYLGWLLPNIEAKGSLWKTLGLCALSGFASFLVPILPSGKAGKDIGIWFAITIGATLVYGLVFWLINCGICKGLRSGQGMTKKDAWYDRRRYVFMTPPALLVHLF